jgi:hypothetical protein
VVSLFIKRPKPVTIKIAIKSKCLFIAFIELGNDHIAKLQILKKCNKLKN